MAVFEGIGQGKDGKPVAHILYDQARTRVDGQWVDTPRREEMTPADLLQRYQTTQGPVHDVLATALAKIDQLALTPKSITFNRPEPSPPTYQAKQDWQPS